MNLLSAAERLASIDRSAVSFDPQRCLRAFDSRSTCSACTDLCPTGAIQVEERVAFHAEKCTSCLACLPTCPTNAFSADDAVQALLTCAARLESGLIELVCMQHPGPRQGPFEDQIAVQVRGCLAGLGAGAYVSLAALGMKQISARIDVCSTCSWSSLLPQIDAQIELARQLLSGRGVETQLQTTDASAAKVERPVWNADNPPLSRRDLFHFASRQGQVALARSMAKDTMSHGPRAARDRQRIHTALEHFSQVKEADCDSLLESGFAHLTVTDNCTACGVCGRACPTGALDLEKEENRFRLIFSAWKCTGCEVCLHVCAQNAIRIDSRPSCSQVFGKPQEELRAGELVQCQHCNTWFAASSGQKYCPACEYRRQNPFGSRMPPGLDVSKLRSLRKNV